MVSHIRMRTALTQPSNKNARLNDDVNNPVHELVNSIPCAHGVLLNSPTYHGIVMVYVLDSSFGNHFCLQKGYQSSGYSQVGLFVMPVHSFTTLFNKNTNR